MPWPNRLSVDAGVDCEDSYREAESHLVLSRVKREQKRGDVQSGVIYRVQRDTWIHTFRRKTSPST